LSIERGLAKVFLWLHTHGYSPLRLNPTPK
jgi:hypothetical protein